MRNNNGLLKQLLCSALVVYTCVVPLIARAADRAELPLKSPRLEGKTAKGIFSKDNRTILGVVVGRDNLDDVVRKLGPAQTFRVEGTDTRPNALCYRSQKTGDTTLLVLSAGPLGGFKTITSALVAPREAFYNKPKLCTPIERVDAKLSTDAGLRLGLPLDSASHILGKEPFVNSRDINEFAFEDTLQKALNGKETEIYVQSGVMIRSNNSAVHWYYLYFVESL